MLLSRAILGLAAVIVSIVAGSMALRRGGMDPSTAGAPMVVAGSPGETVEPVPPEAIAFMESGRPWRAARFMASYLAQNRLAAPEAVLFAARAEAGWGGWAAVRGYLDDRDWLDTVRDGEGWYWLGRAREDAGDVPAARTAYERYLELAPSGTELTRLAEIRIALLRMRDGRSGAAALERLVQADPEIADWLRVLSTEALAATGDTARVRAITATLPQEAGIRHRGRLALVAAYEAAGDRAGQVQTAVALKALGGSATQRAELALAAGRAAVAAGATDVARRELRDAIALAPGGAAGRTAASMLIDLPGITLTDRLAIAGVDERHGNNARAAEGYRAWLAGNTGTADQRADARLRLGRVLFAAGRFNDAESALASLLEGSSAVAREAMMLTGRSQYRRGEQRLAFTTFERLATRFPGSVEGSEALYLIADLRHDDGEIASAASTYRRVATQFRGTDRAGLSLMRLAGIRYQEGDFASAAATWEEYRSSYPTGERWLQSTYWAGRAYERQGDTERARSMYQAARRRDPLSYYAVRSSERLGTPFWPISLGASPPEDPAARRRVAEWLRGVDLLRSAGLHREAEAEVDRVVARAGSDAAALYALAEALNERGYAIRGIRIGQDLQSSGGLNLRLLRILYPFPYREIVEAEAREKDLDPFVVAALMRQESLFTARISSPVGARGLMQIMPETGDALARGAGIREWDVDLLFEPEINVHLGTRYLAEQMDRYDGSLPSVFSAYNAGPHRIDAWKAFPEFGDEELFTERIPFRETRDYVKILTRNIQLYRGLYGG